MNECAQAKLDQAWMCAEVWGQSCKEVRKGLFTWVSFHLAFVQELFFNEKYIL